MRFHIYISLLLICYSSFSKAQNQENIISIIVKDDRVELIKVLQFLNSKKPKSIFISTSLECLEDETDNQLFQELNNFSSLFIASELLPFGTKKYKEIIGCSIINPDGAQTGFNNLLTNNENIVEKIPINYSTENDAFLHFSVLLAKALDFDKATKFLKTTSDTFAIEFSDLKKFKTYQVYDLNEDKLLSADLKDEIIVLGVFPFDYFFVKTNNMEFIKMPDYEIFINIAFEMIREHK